MRQVYYCLYYWMVDAGFSSTSFHWMKLQYSSLTVLLAQGSLSLPGFMRLIVVSSGSSLLELRVDCSNSMVLLL